MDKNTLENQIDLNFKNKKDLDTGLDLYKSLAQGDPYALKSFKDRGYDLEKIKLALQFLTSNEYIANEEKIKLLSESWRINFKSKPPTPEEFVTEKYLGPAASGTFPYVKETFIKFMDPTQPYRNLVLYPCISWGKDLYVESKVMTPEGYKKIKDIQVGDTVCTPDGKATLVQSKQDYPEDKIYKITFGDGRVVYTGGPHFWKAARSYDNSRWDPEQGKYVIKSNTEKTPSWKLITTEKILEDMESHPDKNRGWFIPLTHPVIHQQKDHLISPYTLGALLGDSYLGGKQIIIGNDDQEILQRILQENQNKDWKITFTDLRDLKEQKKRSVKYTLSFTHSSLLKTELQRLQLTKTHSDTKFIPDEYKYDSIENRIALLQGLMDTDGCVECKKTYPRASFYTRSERLKNDFVELCSGLGAARCVVVLGKRDNVYRITITFPSNSFSLFSLERKQKYIDEEYAKDKSKPHSQHKPQVLHIKSIEKTDLVGGCCIETSDDERLFLTDNYIVTHNSYLSTIITLYIATHVALMRDPHKYFGLNVAGPLAQMLVSYSLKKSSELLLEPFMNLLEASPFFERVQRQDTMKELEAEFASRDTVDKLYWTTAYPTSALGFSSGSSIKLASNPNALTGLNLISIVFSELAFFTDAGKSSEFIMRLYQDGRQRVRSRLQTNEVDPVTGNKIVDYYGRTIIDSSPNDLDNAIDDFCVNKAPLDRTNFIIDGSRWKWRPEEFKEDLQNHQMFKVFTGSKGNPPKILDENDPLLTANNAATSKVIEVPNGLRSVFESDLAKALKDWAGIPTGSSDNLIYDYKPVEKMFDNHLKNIYLNIEAPEELSPQNLIWNKVSSTFFKNKGGKYEFYYKPHTPRCVSVDQSYATDVTSIAMSHRERLFDTGEDIYVVDFTIVIIPTKGSHINLEAIHQFIKDLRDKGSLYIEHVSFDQFQSETTLQNLKREGFDVEKLSVDKSTDPYLNMLSLINRGQIACGKNIFLKNNLKSLHLSRTQGKTGKPKVDHDNSREQVLTGDSSWETSKIGSYGKDCSDSVCASLELCRKYYNVVEDTWTGGPTVEETSNKYDASKAKTDTTNLLAKLGLGF